MYIEAGFSMKKATSGIHTTSVNVTVKSPGMDILCNGQRGDRLIDVIRKAGTPVLSPCGGRGLCKKCRVFVIGTGSRFSCSYKVNHDVEVVLPEIGKARILESGRTEDKNLILCSGIEKGVEKGSIPRNGYCESDICIEQKERTGTGEDIVLAPRDVREVQVAKAALRAGMQVLMNLAGVGLGDIEHVYCAGAFGNFMNAKNAAAIGLVPPQLADKIVCVGNAAGYGARLALRSVEFEKSLEKIAGSAKYIELSGRADFNEEFVKHLDF
jgi:uncharacterized 2Fe-2S/4Fe-4S cluster protein (DUF4445 family)